MRSEGDTAAVAPAGAVSRRDGWAALALAALFVVMLAATWQRWTHPIIDHGRELNLPARILAGEQLWELVRAGRARGSNRVADGIPAAGLQGLIERLERI